MWIEELTRALAGAEREFWPRIVAEGYRARRWPWEAFEVMGQLREVPPPPKARRPRLPPRTRLRRWDERPELPSGQHMQAMSADPILDWGISDGALRTLGLICVLSGQRGRVLTQASSLAKLLGRHRNTIGNHLRELAEARWVTLVFDRRTGQTLIVLSWDIEPRRRPEGKPAVAHPRMPQPRPWRRGGAQFVGHIKVVSKKEALRGCG